MYSHLVRFYQPSGLIIALNKFKLTPNCSKYSELQIFTFLIKIRRHHDIISFLNDFGYKNSIRRQPGFENSNFQLQKSI